jgi:hypothetical protein
MERACAILSAACLVTPYISTLSHKRQDFRKKVAEYKMFIFTFSTIFFLKDMSFQEEFSEILS